MLESALGWYQGRISLYDKQSWETTVEQRILQGLSYTPRKTTKFKTELIDVDLVRGSTFPKAKPQSGIWLAGLHGVSRLILLPFYGHWWIRETSCVGFFMVLFLYASALFSAIIMFFCRHDKTLLENVPASEVYLPGIVLLVLSIIHSQIVCTRNSCTMSSPNHKGSRLAMRQSRRIRSLRRSTSISGRGKCLFCSNVQPPDKSRQHCNISKKHLTLLKSGSSYKMFRSHSEEPRQEEIYPLQPRSSSENNVSPPVDSKDRPNIIIFQPSSEQMTKQDEAWSSSAPTSSSERSPIVGHVDAFGDHLEVTKTRKNEMNNIGRGINTCTGNLPSKNSTNYIEGLSNCRSTIEKDFNNSVGSKLSEIGSGLIWHRNFQSLNHLESKRHRKSDNDGGSDGEESGMGELEVPTTTRTSWIGRKATRCSRCSRLFSQEAFLCAEKSCGTLFCDSTGHLLCPRHAPCAFNLTIVGTDALSLDWNRWNLIYLFPPVKALPLVISYLPHYKGRVVLVAPWWPAQSRFPTVLGWCSNPIPFPKAVLSQFKTSDGNATRSNRDHFPSAGIERSSCNSSCESDADQSPSSHYSKSKLSEYEWTGITTNSDDLSYSSESEGGWDDNESLERRFTHSEALDWNIQGSPAAIITSTSNVSDKVSCKIFEGVELKKVDLSVLDISSAVISRVDNLQHNTYYLQFGLGMAIMIALVPSIYRLDCSAIREFMEAIVTTGPERWLEIFIASSKKILIGLSGSNLWATTVIFISLVNRFCLAGGFFFLLSVAERTFKQRFLYAKHFCYLTSARRARKYDLPHFRLNKVHNIKTWLSVRSCLKKRGPQRSVDVIVSSTFFLTLLLVSYLCFELLKEDEKTEHSLYNIELFFWCFPIGIYLIRFMTLGAMINKKYSSLSVLITEQINMYLHMEQKPQKKDELMLANNVLKLVSVLLKELESPFKISGLSANPLLYNITRLVVLSACSGVLSDLLGFKLKLHKIKFEE